MVRRGFDRMDRQMTGRSDSRRENVMLDGFESLRDAWQG